MSLATWKEEFYPVEAGTIAAVAPEDALAHSLRKWRGLTPENLARHGVIRAGSHLYGAEEIDAFAVTSSNCALCLVHLKLISVVCACGDCPLVAVRDGQSCDAPAGDSPYSAFTHSGDPGPMIALLEAAMK